MFPNYIAQPMFQGGQSFPGMGQMPPILGQGFMQQQQQQQQQQQGQQHHGFNLGAFAPMFGLAGMMAGRGGMGMLAPLLGGLAGFGLHKAGVF